MPNQPEGNGRISRDGWPLWLWGFTLFMAASLALAVEAAISSRMAWITMIVQCFGLFALSQITPLEISYSDDLLHVGKAKIDRKFIGTITSLNSEEMRLVRGPHADPAAFLALRFWVSTGVKVEINDPQDSTPYWLISTKRPEKFLKALGR